MRFTKDHEWVALEGDVGYFSRTRAVFDTDHLRRLLVNLLDNARRYASHAAPVHVSTALDAGGALELKIWSDGPPLEPTVQRHLFEPFFSSESRSSGLGLYICRELCERYGASIDFRLAPPGQPRRNQFRVSMRRVLPGPPAT